MFLIIHFFLAYLCGIACYRGICNVNRITKLKKLNLNNFSMNRKISLFATSDEYDNAPKLDPNEDYYSILETSPNASQDELKKAYYKVVFKYHPDNREEKFKDLANQQMMNINFAYRILRDKDNRAIYDQQRKLNRNKVSTYYDTNPSGSNDDNSNIYDAYSYPINNQRASYYKDSSEDNRTDKVSMSPSAARFKKFMQDSPFTEVWQSELKKKVTVESNKFTTSINEEPVLREEIEELLSIRGDGSISTLENIIDRLRFTLKTLTEKLSQDTRDWGSVKDSNEIEKRLKAVDDVRRLNKRITELNEEVFYRKFGDIDRQNNRETVFDSDLGDNNYASRPQTERFENNGFNNYTSRKIDVAERKRKNSRGKDKDL